MNKYISFLLIVVLAGCSAPDKNGLKFVEKGRNVPEFSSDSAYTFVQQQVDFGPRIPNTESHSETRKYLENKLKSYAGRNSVFTQNFTQQGYDETLNLSNIIAAFNPAAPDRIMLCAHWDTRAVADADSSRTDESFPGADDGGSGVAILLELARLFGENPPPVGVDIVLFDGEDYGRSGDLSNYFLGSRYWVANPPVPGYSPRFGILLDMVGAKNARFPKENYSVNYAPNLVYEVWSIAAEKGYGDLFLNEEGATVSDDHYIINQQAHIPMIDIINHNRRSDNGGVFASHWHTHSDNMDIISKETLHAVGQVLAELIYNRI